MPKKEKKKEEAVIYTGPDKLSETLFVFSMLIVVLCGAFLAHMIFNECALSRHPMPKDIVKYEDLVCDYGNDGWYWRSRPVYPFSDA